MHSLMDRAERCREKWAAEDQATGMRGQVFWHLACVSPLHGHYWLLNGVSRFSGAEKEKQNQ